MSGNIPAYGKIGLTAKEVLSGGKEGVYQYAQKATVSAKTVDGVDYTATVVKQDKDSLAISLRTAYAADMLKFTGTFTQAGKIIASVAATDLAPGLTANITGTIPDINTAKLGFDYVLPHLTLNGAVSLTSSPVIELAATTGRADLFVGGQATFSSTKNDITAWTLGAGLTRKDFQIGVSLLDKGQTVKAVYAHAISPTSLAAAEVVRNVTKQEQPTAIALGFQKRLDTGALAKIRVESNGLTSLHYETLFQPKNKVGLSAQLDAKDLNKAPKLGGFIDVSH